jgi:hypothetical protein
MEKFTVTFLYGASDKGRLQNFSREVSAEYYEVVNGQLNFFTTVGITATFAAGEWKWVEKQSALMIPAFGNA